MAEKQSSTAVLDPPVKRTTAGERSLATTNDDGEVDVFAVTANCIGDLVSVLQTPFTVASQALANNPNGPIMDITGNVGLAMQKLREAAVLLVLLDSVTIAADPAHDILHNVWCALTGTAGTPATQLITTMTNVLKTGPAAVTVERVSEARGPIMDWSGNVGLVRLKLIEADTLLTTVLRVVDAADPNKTKLGNVAETLA